MSGGPIDIYTKGQDVPFTFDRDGATVTGWVCTIYVKEFKADTALISRVITLDGNNQWTGFLTSTETDTLSVPTLYRLIAVLTNSTTDEEEVQTMRFQLNDAWN